MTTGMDDIKAQIEAAIKNYQSMLRTGHMPGIWNHFPHDDDDYHDNQLRSKMNGLEQALWILNGSVGKSKKWG